ncbi:MAG: hypothetical protein HYV07_13040 [Deltaproteobacteria bacterium]|nr:hypothetical protein [Deltaproteobacteria bacterium]
MIQILVQLDEQTAKDLEKLVPAKSRRRSQFIRLAIQSAMMRLLDKKTRRAYEKIPDDEPAYFDPATWSETPPRVSKKSRKRK